MKVSHQLYEDEPFIKTLNATNFDEAVTNSTEVWVVKFYSPRCRHSISLVPEFKVMALRIKNELPIGVIDCLQEKILCRDYDVYSYPRIAFMYKSFIIDYSGPSHADDMISAARNAKRDYREMKKIKIME